MNAASDGCNVTRVAAAPWSGLWLLTPFALVLRRFRVRRR